MTATIRLERKMPGMLVDVVDRKRAWQVHLDGQSVGAITRNDVLEVPVELGPHRLQLISGGKRISPEHTFDVHDESTVEFTCHPQPIWPLLLMALVIPHRWIVLKQH